MDILGTVLVGIAILVGLVGIVIPILPGSLVIWIAIGVWAIATDVTTSWIVFGLCTAAFVASLVVQYAIPGKRLRRAGVPGKAMLLGAIVGVVGFFIVPVIGLFLGFVLGVYVYEAGRHRTHEEAWNSTKHAMKAAGFSILIELSGGLVSASIWVVGVVLT